MLTPGMRTILCKKQHSLRQGELLIGNTVWCMSEVLSADTSMYGDSGLRSRKEYQLIHITVWSQGKSRFISVRRISGRGHQLPQVLCGSRAVASRGMQIALGSLLHCDFVQSGKRIRFLPWFNFNSEEDGDAVRRNVGLSLEEAA
jgi:hypothetical protein